MDLLIVRRRSTGHTAGFSRRASMRTLGLTLAVVLLATLLVPLAQPAGAAADPTGEDQTTIARQGETDGTTEETPVAEETPVTEETPVAEETPATDGATNTALTGGNTSRIVIFIRECTTDYGADFFQFDAKCNVPTTATFELYGFDNYGTYLYETGTTFFDTHVAGGSYTMRNHIPQGYREPTVFCTKGFSAVPYKEVVSYDGYYEFSLAENEHIGCHFFNIPKNAPVSYGALQLEYSVCPPVESIPFPFDYATANVGQLATVCSLYRDAPVAFNLKNPSAGFDLTMYTDPANNAIASWASAPTGTVFLTTEPWASYGSPRVFCYYDNAPTNVFETTVQGWNASFTISRGVWAVCTWFNIPAPTQASQTGGTVAVVTHYCDDISNESIDPYDTTHEMLLLACQPYTGDQVSFELDHQDAGTAESRTTGVGGDGAALWEAVPGGDLTITETSGTEGYGEPVVFCSTNDPKALVLDSTFAEIAARDYSINFELSEDFSLYCDWFNIPYNEDAGGAVTVLKHDCPAATDEDDYEWFAATCTKAVEGVYFKLDGESGGNPGDYPTDANGRVRWSGLEEDRFYLYEELPAGYGTPVVFCDTDGHVDDYRPKTTPDADPFDYRIEFDLDEGEHIVCYWYNIPEHDGQHQDETGAIEIYLWLCPAGYDLNSAAADLRATCNEMYESVKFSISGPERQSPYSYYDEQPTGNDIFGGVIWQDLTPGVYGIEETIPEGIAGGVIVGCDGDDFPSMTVSLKAGQHIVCDWFNVPATGGEQMFDDSGSDQDGASSGQNGGAVIVYTWTCPNGDTQNLTNLYEACAPGGEAIPFHLIDSEGNDATRSTDDRSRVQWVGISAGAYRLRAESPSGGAAIAYCDLVEGAENWMPERWTVTAGAIAFTHEGAGWDVVCDWFNISEPAENDAIAKASIGKHRCAAADLAAPDCSRAGERPDLSVRSTDGAHSSIGLNGGAEPVGFVLPLPHLDLTTRPAA